MAMLFTMPLTSLDFDFLEDDSRVAQGPGGGGNNGTSITIPANQTLAWDSVISFGAVNYDGLSDIVSHNGNTYAIGTYSNNISLNGQCSAESNNFAQINDDEALPFVAKFDNNGTCMWMNAVNVTNQQHHLRLAWATSSKIAVDSNGDVYFSSSIHSSGNTEINFGNTTISNNGQYGFLAKIDSNGTWQWIQQTGGDHCPCSVAVDNGGNVWVNSYRNEGVNHNIFEKYDSDGNLSISKTFGNAGRVRIYATATDSSSNMYFTGYFEDSFSATINGTTLNFQETLDDLIIGKTDSNGNLLWIKTPDASSSASRVFDLAIHNDDEIYITGEFFSQLQLGSYSENAGGSSNGFLAKINSSGEWQGLTEIESSGTISSRSLTIDVSGNPYIAGHQYSGLVNYGNGVSVAGCCGDSDAFVAKFDPNGQAQWAKSFGGGGYDRAYAIHSDNRGHLWAGGFYSGAAQIGGLQLSSTGYTDLFIARMSVDYDGDDIADVNDVDDDGDFIHDPLDSCPYSQLGFRSTGSSDHDSDGCNDELEDDDDDNDMLNDTLDNCPKGMTGWIRTNSSDFDDDGCMDALEDYDDDNDGIEDYEDYCSRIPGNSTFELEKGCPDADGDGRPDILDPFPNNASEWQDRDGDEVGDNADAFPLDATQQSDTDGDTYGDEEFGNAGDSCSDIFGNSTLDRYGCLDTDGDGWSDAGDDFPNDAEEYLDTDGDTVPNHLDEFPFDPTQQTDSDDDGYGDNKNGNLGDAFPNDSTKHADSDRDGVDDTSDAFPYDPTQTEDTDGDGMGDNPMGIGADKFPDDASQWGDIDGDGVGDNPNGTNPDAFITDATQWADRDGDGYGDNPAGRLYDLFPDNPTQWIDDDGDGLGDNQNGTVADPYLNDYDNDGYDDSIDIFPKLASPGDLDDDNCMDEDDDFPDNRLECLDTDGDGTGDNADADDDGDGWTDADESRAGTDPLDPNDTPVDSFEIVIPGTAVGLGAWDLIGMFGGIPLFMWIGFGFMTRNGRTAKYEGLLREAQTRDELEEVAHMWEYSLMLRMLGPHQGIRLERLRAELDDRFEAQNQTLSSIEPQQHDHTEMVEQSMQDETTHVGPMQMGQKSLPSIETTQPEITAQGNPDGKGYEWHSDGQGTSWYRNEGSNSEWQRFDA